MSCKLRRKDMDSCGNVITCYNFNCYIKHALSYKLVISFSLLLPKDLVIRN